MTYKILGKLPDPFLKDDGTKMSPREWMSARGEIFNKITKIEFGGLPPRADFVKAIRISMQSTMGKTVTYKIIAGYKERYFSYLMDITPPKGAIDGSVKYPVMLTGDACFNNCESDVIEAAGEMGIAVARFNRLEMACDNTFVGKVGGVYDLFPEDDEFSAISAWAWGYITTVTALSEIPYVDMDNIAITGHSRGGKTILLAAAADERIKFACPNNSGCHGASSYRLQSFDMGEDKKRSEQLSDLLDVVPYWLGPKMKNYRGREQELPYDMHYFGALIAPRYYLQVEGLEDYWSNPLGAWHHSLAVRQAYRYLGCEDNVAAYFRDGGHRQKLPDFLLFLNFIRKKIDGGELPSEYTQNPYPCINFD